MRSIRWGLSVLVLQVGCSSLGGGKAPHLDVSSSAKRCGVAGKEFCVSDESVVNVLRTGELTVRNMQPTPAGTTSVKKLRLEFVHPTRGDTLLYVKWRSSPGGGDGFNNDPRKELAAYALSNLFFEAEDGVVPPTIARCFDLEKYGGNLGETKATFKNTQCVFGVISVWLEGVEAGRDKLFDKERAQTDPAYRTAIANLNLFAMLIDHGDSHWNNLVISKSNPPRAFVIDSGLAFGGFVNPKVYFGIGEDKDWSTLLLKSFPSKTIERLRALDSLKLDSLATVVEFEKRGGQLMPVKPGPPLDASKGVRETEERVQLGLTEDEIAGIKTRLARLIESVDSGEVDVY